MTKKKKKKPRADAGRPHVLTRSISPLLEDALKERRLSADKLEEKINITRGSVGRILRLESLPSPSLLGQIAEGLEAPVDHLLAAWQPAAVKNGQQTLAEAFASEFDRCREKTRGRSKDWVHFNKNESAVSARKNSNSNSSPQNSNSSTPPPDGMQRVQAQLTPARLTEGLRLLAEVEEANPDMADFLRPSRNAMAESILNS